MSMLVGMDIDFSLLRAAIAATNALDGKLRWIGVQAMHGRTLTDHDRYAAVADQLERDALRREYVGAGVTR